MTTLSDIYDSIFPQMPREERLKLPTDLQILNQEDCRFALQDLADDLYPGWGGRRIVVKMSDFFVEIEGRFDYQEGRFDPWETEARIVEPIRTTVKITRWEKSTYQPE